MENNVHTQETRAIRDIAMYQLERLLRSELFRKRGREEVIKEIVKNRLVMPEGKTPDNVLQDSFIYEVKKGYDVIVYSGTLDSDFIKPGLPSVLMRNNKQKMVFYREFKRDDFEKVFKKLILYARFCKNIANLKPKGMQLFEDRKLGELQYRWVGQKGKTLPFNAKDFLNGFDDEDRKLLLKSEANKKSYYKTSKSRVKNRKRDTKKTWRR